MKTSALHSLIKSAVFEKKADPPHRGLNDDNPMARHIYKNFGWIEPHPYSYLGQDNPESYKRYNAQSDAAYRWLRDPANEDKVYKGRYVGVPETWDFSKKRGAVDNSAHTWYAHVPEESVSAAYRRGAVNRVSGFTFPGFNLKYKEPALSGVITLGSYPQDGELVFDHEFGHAKDLAGLSRKQRYEKPTLQKEEDAWSLAGVPAGHPLREAALATYRYTPDAIGPGSNVSPAALHSNFLNTAASYYSPPSAYIGRKQTSGVPVIYDYASAIDTLNGLSPTPRGDASFDRAVDRYGSKGKFTEDAATQREIIERILARQIPDYEYLDDEGTPIGRTEYEESFKTPEELEEERQQFISDDIKNDMKNKLENEFFLLDNPEYAGSSIMLR